MIPLNLTPFIKFRSVISQFSWNVIAKNIFDRLFSAIGFVTVLPFMTILYIIVKLEQPTYPALYAQERIGRNGKVFKIFKFRTLDERYVYATSVSVAGKLETTPFGRFLRQSKLNELPQLWNVLCGDMSLVGPRPDVPGYADLLKGEDRLILQMRPGLTGPATLKYRDEEVLLSKQSNPLIYNDTVIYPDKVKINLHYFKNHNLLTDIKILWCTITGTHMLYNGEII